MRFLIKKRGYLLKISDNFCFRNEKTSESHTRTVKSVKKHLKILAPFILLKKRSVILLQYVYVLLISLKIHSSSLCLSYLDYCEFIGKCWKCFYSLQTHKFQTFNLKAKEDETNFQVLELSSSSHANDHRDHFKCHQHLYILLPRH